MGTAAFVREYGCTEADWLRCLPGATRDRARLGPAPAVAEIDLGEGRLRLRWASLPPRRIALMHMPRLEVHFEFDAVDDGARAHFLRHFDLYMQRGGG